MDGSVSRLLDGTPMHSGPDVFECLTTVESTSDSSHIRRNFISRAPQVGGTHQFSIEIPSCQMTQLLQPMLLNLH